MGDFMINNILYYSVGALLYCPANNESVADSIISGKFGNKYSLALCLEDTINDAFVAEAEQTLIKTVQKLHFALRTDDFYLPKIFIRVRNSSQIVRLTKEFLGFHDVVTGFIIPKFNTSNARSYIDQLELANSISPKKLYMMPIYESHELVDLRNRVDVLYMLKDMLSSVNDLVLNIRVGGNDLCHLYGFRRHMDESIHRIKPIANIFSDIVTVYGMDYVISGPVFEYYNGDNFEECLSNEIYDDKLCGLIGKTVIHPNQIPVVNQSLMVSKNDYEDAVSILNWDKKDSKLVAGSINQSRMNEYKTHTNWAEKIMYLSEYYGIN